MNKNILALVFLGVGSSGFASEKPSAPSKPSGNSTTTSACTANDENKATEFQPDSPENRARTIARNLGTNETHYGKKRKQRKMAAGRIRSVKDALRVNAIGTRFSQKFNVEDGPEQQ